MTNILYHRPTNREEAVVEGSSNGVSATNSDENVERSEAVTETMDGSEARAADLLSVIRTNCFACAVSDDDDDEEKEGLLGKEIQQRNLGSSSSGVGRGGEKAKKKKKKEVLDLGDTSSTKPNWWQNILGETSSSNRPNSRLRTRPNPRLSNPPNHLNGELVAAGWPSWLCAVAAEAIYGWTPRRADSFERLDKIGLGLRSDVYKARDLMTGKFVALKKVRFENLEPESVKLMAREILVLRRLDHPNVMKLEGLVTPKISWFGDSSIDEASLHLSHRSTIDELNP